MTKISSWQQEIELSERECKKFHERAQTTVKRYLDERDMLSGSAKWFNIFYANTQILESALYSQLPKPMVTRRFKDYDDDVARVAALILQRCITQDLDDPEDTFDSTMRQAVQDRLVAGLGSAWLRLETQTEDVPYQEYLTYPNPQPDTDAVLSEREYAKDPMKRILEKKVCVDYVFWKDFIWSPCRVWTERRWTGRRVYMDREALVKRFGKAKGEAIPLDYKPVKLGEGTGVGSTPQDDGVQKACIYEIWVRNGRRVIWISKGMPDILDEKKDPLKLKGFEPCPRPMLANISTSNTVPRPDYYMLQDQYSELDTINNRISKLIQACKVVGVYDKGSPAIARMLKEGFDNDLIPADNWAMFAEKGGIEGQVSWLPLEVVVQALTQLQLAREAIKNQIYELTGIADIVRGATKASETLGAQEIKAKFASVRIKKLQDEVSRFAGEILRIKAEIMCRHFDQEELYERSNIAADSEDQAFVQQALELLETETSFEWRIQVTSDSIAQADYDMEKADRVEFLTAVSSYLEKAAGMFQTVPQSAALLVGMLKWAIAGFKNTQDIEGLLDKAFQQLLAQPPEDKPDPEAQKREAEVQKMQQQAELDKQKGEQQMAIEQKKLEMQERKQEMELFFAQQKHEMEMRFKQQEALIDQQQKQAEMQFNALMERMQMGFEQRRGEQELAIDAQRGRQELAQGEQRAAVELKNKDAAAKQDLKNKKAAAAAEPKSKKE